MRSCRVDETEDRQGREKILSKDLKDFPCSRARSRCIANSFTACYRIALNFRRSKFSRIAIFERFR